MRFDQSTRHLRVSDDESNAEPVPTVQLSAEQEAVADGVLQRIYAGETHTAIDAVAGAGKSELALQMADRLEAQGFSVGFSALAHRAVGVLRNRRGKKGDNFRTLAKLLAVRDIGGEARPKFQHDPSATPLFGERQVEFIDEAGMVNEQLTLILEQLAQRYPHVRVVALGDRGQIPAVGDPPGTVSHLLRPADPEGLFSLETVHRHAGLILDFANSIRKLDLRQDPDWDAFIDGERIIRHRTKAEGLEAMQELVAEHHNEGINDQIRWLSWRNKAVDAAADASIEAIPGRDLSRPYQLGDLLIARAPAHDPHEDLGFEAIAQINNADELTIATTPRKVYNLSLPGWRGNDAVPLPFVWECVVHGASDGKAHTIWLPDPSDRAAVQRLVDDRDARGRKAKAATSGEFEGKTAGQWRYRGRGLLQVLGHGITHRTACSVHRAQGGGWDVVFVDVADIRGLLQRVPGHRPADPFGYRAMLYTGATRAQRTLHLVGV